MLFWSCGAGIAAGGAGTVDACPHEDDACRSTRGGSRRDTRPPHLDLDTRSRHAMRMPHARSARHAAHGGVGPAPISHARGIYLSGARHGEIAAKPSGPEPRPRSELSGRDIPSFDVSTAVRTENEVR